MAEPPPRRFKVGMSGAHRERLAAEGAWAIAHGRAAEFAAALREIEFRLMVEPHEWGESRAYLPVMRVRLRCGISRMVMVLYGVAEDRDVVFVREFHVNRHWKPPRPPS